MAQGTKERQDRLDDELNPASRSMPSGTSVNAGIDQLEAFANDPSNSTKSDEDKPLAERENEAGQNSSSGNEAATSGVEKSLFNPKSKKNKSGKRRLTRNQKIGIGGGSFGAILLTLAGFSILQGPFQLIQFSQFLQGAHFFNNENFGNERTSKLTLLYRYSRTGTVQGTRLGAITGKYADRWDKKLLDNSGLRPVYDDRTGRMAGFEVVDEDKAKDVLKELDDDGVDTDAPRDNVNAGRDGQRVNGRVVSLDDSSNKSKRSAIRTVTRSVDVNRISSSIGSRVLIKLGGVDFRPIKGLTRKAGDSLANLYDRKKTSRDEIIKNGADTPEANQLRGDTEVDPETNEPVDSPDNNNLANEVNEEVAEIKDAKSKGRLASLRKSFAARLGGGAAAAVGVLCAVRDIGNEAEDLQYANTILPMMRMGVEFVALGSQVMANSGITLDEVGYYSSLLYDEETGLGHMAAASSQAESGQAITGPDIDPGVKPSSVDGKPLLFDIVDQVFRLPGLSFGCSVQGFIGKLPGVSQVSALGEGAINVALSPFGTSVPELTQSLLNWIAGEAVNLAAEGATLGNYINYGARLAANTAALAFGGRNLNGTESAQLKQENREIIAYENSQKSFSERYFDIYDTNSVAANAYRQAPRSFGEAFASLFRGPIKTIDSLSGQAFAQDNYDYDYGFNLVGMSKDEQENPIVQDPYENAQYVESNGIISQYADCFPTKVDPSTGALSTQSYNDDDAINQFNIDAGCQSPNDNDLLRYRFYLADMINAKSLACYEGDEEACREVGFDNVQASSPETGTTPSASGPITIQGDSAFPLAVTKSQVGSGIFNNGDTDQAGHPYIAYDLIAAKGITSVAMTDGTIVRVSSMCGGNTTGITLNVPSQGISIWYGHQDPATVLVSEGQQVTAGTPLAQLVDHTVDCASGADHLHIDASVNIGTDVYRPGCSRSSCTNQERFRSIGPQLYELYQALPD